MTGKRRYSDDERSSAIAALAANGGNVQRTARDLGIPEVTLRQWSKGQRHPEAIQMSERKKGDLADALESMCWKIVGLAEEKASDASFKDLMIGLGIGVDKTRLLRELPTSISENKNSSGIDLGRLSDEELLAYESILLKLANATGSTSARVETTQALPESVPVPS